VFLNLLYPVGNIFKTFIAGAIVSKNYTVCSAVVGLSDRSEPLLACSVPDLNFYTFSIKIYSLDFEVNAC
jgi:hypothetical protein